ncbi:MAG: helix-turn-helix transcriptional regulator [Acidobacteriota bacterium]
MVFDNFQEAGAVSFHAVMSYALDTIPEGVTVITLSRYKPPAQLSLLRASNGIAFVGWNEVSFTRKESGEMMKAQGNGRPDDETVALLHEKTEGWAAGLVLMMAGAGPSASALRAFGDGTQAGIFYYFAS